MAGPLEVAAVAVAAFVYRTGRTGLYFAPLRWGQIPFGSVGTRLVPAAAGNLFAGIALAYSAAVVAVVVAAGSLVADSPQWNQRNRLDPQLEL